MKYMSIYSRRNQKDISLQVHIRYRSI